MYRPADQELKQAVEAFRKVMENSAPLFRVVAEQFKMAAQNLTLALQVFGAELNKSMEEWSNNDGDDEENTETRK